MEQVRLNELKHLSERITEYAVSQPEYADGWSEVAPDDVGCTYDDFDALFENGLFTRSRTCSYNGEVIKFCSQEFADMKPCAVEEVLADMVKLAFLTAKAEA